MSAEQSPLQPPDASAIRDWMVAYITSVIDVTQEPFPVDARFDHYGLDSVEATIMAGMIEEQFGVELNLEDVLENPSVTALSSLIGQRLVEQASRS